MLNDIDLGRDALETVKILVFSPPLWKRGAGGDFIIKTIHLTSMAYCFVKSPSIPLFLRGRSKAEYFYSLFSFTRMGDVKESCLSQ